jgi:hypothetical protein
VQPATGLAVLRTTGSTNTGTSTTSSSGRSTVSAPSGTSSGGCTGPDPFKKIGGVGLCVNGEWLALWKPKKK